MRYIYKTQGTCSREIAFDITDNVVSNISFAGGCSGNLKALSTVLDGWTADDITKKLAGNKCGFKSTSCADQLSKAVQKAKSETNKNS